MIRRLATAALILVALGAALGACGRKGPPVAPEQRIPRPVSDLDAVVHESGIEVRWTNPTRRADNTRVRDLEVVRVFRLEDGGGGEPRPALLERGRVRGYTEIGTIRLAAPAPSIREGDRVIFDDRRGLTLGRRYTYTIVAADSQGRSSSPSPRLSVTFVAVPEPPRDLVAEAGEREVRLRWIPPVRLTDGHPPTQPLGYEVLRAPGADAPLTPVRETAEPQLTDRDLENERTYAYAVRAVRMLGGTRVVSAPTPRVLVTPVDMTPPAPPTDLVAIPSPGTVQLSWRPSPDTDVERYIVYRATAGRAFERIGSTPAPATTFVDRDVAPGRYRYVVTAEDRSSRRNESGRSNDVTVSAP